MSYQPLASVSAAAGTFFSWKSMPLDFGNIYFVDFVDFIDLNVTWQHFSKHFQNMVHLLK